MSKEFIYSLRFMIPGALILWALFIWCVLAMLGGCTESAPYVAPIRDHERCVPDSRSYALGPDGHKWYLDCTNQERP